MWFLVGFPETKKKPFRKGIYSWDFLFILDSQWEGRQEKLQVHLSLEPRHDKTNSVVVRPAQTQISLGIRPVWSESLLSAWK